MIKIFKMLMLIGILFSEVKASEKISPEFYCNYNLLRMKVDTHSANIIESDAADDNTIKRDLIFLENNTQKTSASKQYSPEDFSKLVLKSKEVSPSHQPLQKFILSCSQIFNASNEDLLTQQSVYMLLQQVTQEVEKYFENIRRRKETLSNFKSKQNVTKDPLLHKQTSPSTENEIKGQIVIHNPTYVEHEQFNKSFITEVK